MGSWTGFIDVGRGALSLWPAASCGESRWRSCSAPSSAKGRQPRRFADKSSVEWVGRTAYGVDRDVGPAWDAGTDSRGGGGADKASLVRETGDLSAGVGGRYGWYSGTSKLCSRPGICAIGFGMSVRWYELLLLGYGGFRDPQLGL
jgi:hypothetical protein